MTKTDSRDAARRRGLEAAHLQALEGNPLTEEDRALFEMFDREGWSVEQCIAHILKLAAEDAEVTAAE